MSAIRWIFRAHVLVAAGCMALAYGLTGEWPVVPAFLLIFVLWLLAESRAEGGLGGLFMSLLLAAGALSVFLGAPTWLALLTSVAALGAWDLDHFLRRLGSAGRVAFETGLARGHLRRLALVEAAGLLAGGLALGARLRLPFWWEVLLVVLVLVGLGRLIEYTRGLSEA